MKKRHLTKLLSLMLSAAMAFTSVIPSYAMESGGVSAAEQAEDDPVGNEDSILEDEKDVFAEDGKTPALDEAAPGADESAFGEDAFTDDDTSSDVDVENEGVAGYSKLESTETKVEAEENLVNAEASDLPSGEDIAQAIHFANLEDRPAAGQEKIDPVITDPVCDAFEIDKKFVGIGLSGENLKRHHNSEGTFAYWYGIEIDADVIERDGYTTTFATDWAGTVEYETGGFADDDYEPAEKHEGAYTFYYGSYSGDLRDFYVSVRYMEGDMIAKTFIIYVDCDDIGVFDPLPEAPTNLEVAPLVDRSDKPIDVLYTKDTYKLGTIADVSYLGKVIVPVSVRGLRKHLAGQNAGLGYWVGFAIPKVEAEGITTSYKQSYAPIEDPKTIADWSDKLDDVLVGADGKATHDTVYFNVEKETEGFDGNTGYVYVKYAVDDKQYVIYTYIFDMSDVETDTGLPAPEAVTKAVAAPLEDKAAGEEKIEKLYDTYGLGEIAPLSEDDEAYDEDYDYNYVIPVNATKLRQHRADNGIDAYWVGVGIPRIDDDGITTEAKAGWTLEGSYQPVENAHTSGFEADGITYDTFYYNAKSVNPAALKDGMVVGLLAVRYTNAAGESATYRFCIDMSGVSADRGYPQEIISEGLIAAKLHDQAAEPIDDNELYESYDLGEVNVNDEKTEATVPVRATGLVKHRVLIGQEEKAGYWVGIGIPRANKGKALFKQSYTAIDDPSTISDWSEGLDSVWPSPTADVPDPKLTHDTVYFNAADERLVKKTGYVYVKYTAERGDSIIYTYKVDMNGVYYSGLPAAEKATALDAAPLFDNAPEGEWIEKLYDEYRVGEITKAGSSYQVPIIAKNLRAHQNNDNPKSNGYWVGLGIPLFEGIKAKLYYNGKLENGIVTYANSVDNLGPAESDYTKGEGKEAIPYLSLYFNAKNTDNARYFAVEYSKDGDSEMFEYVAIFSQIEKYNDLPALSQMTEVQAAKLHDTRNEAAQGSDEKKAAIPDEKLSEGYKVSEVKASETEEGNFIDVSVSADSLLKHKAGEGAGMGYWAGVAIPRIEGANYSIQYRQSYTKIEDPAAIADWKDGLDDSWPSPTADEPNPKITHDTVYFNTAKADLLDEDSKKVGYVYAKYESKRDPDDFEIFTYRVNFDDVHATMASLTKEEYDPVTANVHDNAAQDALKDEDLFAKDSYEVEQVGSEADLSAIKDGYSYTISYDIHAGDLALHTAGNGMAGYWVGVAIPQVYEAIGNVRYAKVKEIPEDYEEITWHTHDELFNEQGDYYSTYFNAEDLAGTKEKRYIIVDITDGNANAKVIYAIGFENITLKQTEYEVVVTELTNKIGVFMQTGQVPNGFVTLKATVKGKDGKAVKGVPVKWISSNPDVAVVSAANAFVNNTNGEGEVTAKVTFNEASEPEIVSITAVVDDEVRASLPYIFYSVTEDDEANRNVTLTLPGETEYTFKPYFTLPSGLEGYETKWFAAKQVPTTEENTVVNTGDDGNVYASNNGTAEIVQAIVDSETGEVIDKFGRIDRESGLLKTPDGYYKVTVDTLLTGVQIVQRKDIYANPGYKYRNYFSVELVCEPETFEMGQIASVEWSSSDPSVAELSSDGYWWYPDVKVHKKGTTQVKAVVTTKSGAKFITSNTITVKPSVKSVAIKKQGTEDMPISIAIKKGNVAKLYTEFEYDPDDEDELDLSVQWEVVNNDTSDAPVATVSSSGIITAFRTGAAVVYATTPDGHEDFIQVVVTDELSSLDLNMTNVVLEDIGDSVILTARGDIADAYLFDWTVDDPGVVEIENVYLGQRCSVTALNKGTAVVTVTEPTTGLSASATVTVGGENVPITSIKPLQTEYELYVDEIATISYALEPENCSNIGIEWESRDPDIVMAYDGGIIRADEEGTTTVTAKAFRYTGKPRPDDKEYIGVTCDFEITVKPQPKAEFITVEPKSLILQGPVPGIKEGETAKLTGKIYPEIAANYDAIEWVSGDESESVVIVDDETGYVMAVGEGSTYIQARAESWDDEVDADKYVKIPVTVVRTVEQQDIDTGRYPAESAEQQAWIGEIGDYVYTGTAIKPEPNVYYGSVLLTKGVDYTLSYKNNVNASINKNRPAVTATLKGNFKGKITQEFSILPAEISEYATINAVSALAKADGKSQSEYKEQLLKPVITFAGKTLKAGKDYDLYYLDDTDGAYEKPGVWGINIVGKGNFTGEGYTEESLADPAEAVNLAKATISGIEKKYYYTGEEIVPENEKVAVSVNGTALSPAEDYYVTYSNNTNLGTATAIFTGIGKCYGSKKVTFKIVPYVTDLRNADVKVYIDGQVMETNDLPEITYVKGGPKPESVEVSVKVGEGDNAEFIPLEKGDYTWSSKFNSKTGIGTVTVKGKGKFFKGSIKAEFRAVRQEMDSLTYVVDDFVYSPKANAYQKNKITVYDLNGKALKAKTDYTVSFEPSSDTPSIGDEVTATITGQGYYEGDAVVSFRIIDKPQQLKAATFAFKVDDEEIAANKFYVKYAGVPVLLTEENIVLRMKKKVGRTVNYEVIDPSEYEIVSIINNNKVGKATVTLRGTGEFAGLKTITFKIKK
jgi:hypothetical protein